MNLLQLLMLFPAFSDALRMRQEVNLPEPSLPPFEPTGDPIVDSVFEAYRKVLRRNPTDEELKRWKASLDNPGAHAFLARTFGVTPPGKGKKFTLDQLKELEPQISAYVLDLVKSSAGPELEKQAQERFERAVKEDTANQVTNKILGAFLGALFGVPEEKQPLKTLAMKQFEAEQKRWEYAQSLLPFQVFLQQFGDLAGLIGGPFSGIQNAVLNQLSQPQRSPTFLDFFSMLLGGLGGFGRR